MICPAFELVGCSDVAVDFDDAIFTSQAAVRFAPKGYGRTAWCVGDATANAAFVHGYNAKSASGNAQDLVQLILTERPKGTVLHLRGEKTHVNVIKLLKQGGLHADEAIVYKKRSSHPSPLELQNIGRATAVILPMFSAETVSIIGSWGLSLVHAKIVAISEDVAIAARSLGAQEIHQALKPDLKAMLATTSRLIA